MIIFAQIYNNKCISFSSYKYMLMTKKTKSIKCLEFKDSPVAEGADRL